MFRLLISALAAFVVVRVLMGLFRAVAGGLRDGEREPVQDGRGGSAGGRSAGGPATRRTPIDRDSAIDVSYTEIGSEEPSAPGQERRAG
jgi:hypothetical protein